MITDKVPGEEHLATLHLSLSDASGDSAIIEYIDGKDNASWCLKSGNEPTLRYSATGWHWDSYWQQINSTVMLPRTRPFC
ncbi:hypothetical protein ACVXHB_30110 [Escherichia coli]